MNFVFFVQGEGRGHLTQAISLQQMLEQAGHTVSRVCVGLPHNRELPEFALRAFAGRLQTYRAPALSFCRGRGLTHAKTTARFLRDLPALHRGFRDVGACLREYRPDRILNFFEPVAGSWFQLHTAPAPVFSLGHQFLLQHPDFVLPPGNWVERRSTLGLIELVGGRTQRIALSFRPLPPTQHKGIEVLPPLLRADARRCTTTREGPVVAYLLNPGYVRDLERASGDFPQMRVRCFSGFENQSLKPQAHNVTRERIHGRRYLEALAESSALISTAGFEAVCEAAYLGKPTILMPVEGHFEQRANALDATRAGLAHWQNVGQLDLGALELRPDAQITARFRQWCDEAPARYLDILTGTKANELTETGEPVLFS
ncbi:MAG: glycosyltransferase family protein [Opitutales bacterium]